MPSPADVEALIDAHIKELADLNGWDASAGKDASGAPLPPREILIIDTVSFFSQTALAGTVVSSAYLKFLGVPSPSSRVTQGYVRFVDRGEIKTPRYDSNTKTITLWVANDMMPLTLEQCRHRDRYLFIRWFHGGIIHCDLHTTP